jgi:hypothetical protein
MSPESGQPVCVPAQLDLMRFWAKVDGCPPSPVTSTVGAITTYLWQGCNAGTAVELAVVKGGGHEVQSLVAGGVSPHDRIWSFLSAHPSSSGSGTTTLRGALLTAKVTGTGGARKLVVRVSVNEKVTARLSLVRGTASVVSNGSSRVAAGTAMLRLAVPKGARPGRYIARVTLRDSSGATLVLKRTVVLPG